MTFSLWTLHRNAKEFYQEFSVNLKKYYRQQEKNKVVKNLRHPWNRVVTFTFVYNTNFVFHKNNHCNVVIIEIFGHLRELGTDSSYFCLRMEDGRLGNNVKHISDKEKMELWTKKIDKMGINVMKSFENHVTPSSSFIQIKWSFFLC